MDGRLGRTAEEIQKCEKAPAVRKNDAFVFKTMNSVFKNDDVCRLRDRNVLTMVKRLQTGISKMMMDFAFKMINSVSIIMYSVFKK